MMDVRKLTDEITKLLTEFEKDTYLIVKGVHVNWYETVDDDYVTKRHSILDVRFDLGS